MLKLLLAKVPREIASVSGRQSVGRTWERVHKIVGRVVDYDIISLVTLPQRRSMPKRYLLRS